MDTEWTRNQKKPYFKGLLYKSCRFDSCQPQNFQKSVFSALFLKNVEGTVFLCFSCSEISGKNRLSVTTKRLCRGLCDTECVTKSPLICEPIRKQKTWQLKKPEKKED